MVNLRKVMLEMRAAEAAAVKLHKNGDGYQTAPLCGSGIGRFQVRRTDNTNARTCGRLPKWSVCDLFKPVRWVRFDTLAEVREWIARRS